MTHLRTASLCCLLLASSLALAQNSKAKKEDTTEAKEVSGMSIVGNNETPKSLTIIPWKSSEIGQETSFGSSLLNQDMVPLDKAAFLRELEFHRLSNPN